MILDASTRGRVTISASDTTVTATGPLTGVSLRVTGQNVTLRGLEIHDADNSTRPAIVDASGSRNLAIDSCVFSGSSGKQQQGVYASGFTNLLIRDTEIGPIGVDPIGGDHCIYIGNGDFLIERCDLHDAAGAGLQLYPGNATGTITDSRLHGNNWGAVVWGTGCRLTVDRCKVYGNHGSRGFGVHAASGGSATVANSWLWANEHGNYSGSVVDGGGNVYAPPSTTPPPPPPPPPVGLRKLSETATTVTLGWDPVPGIAGYWFLVDGRRVSWTSDVSRATVKFGKGGGVYAVQPIQVLGDPLTWQP